jgi:hypothetical protein
MSPEAVEAELGKPSSRIKTTNHTTWIYPNQRKLEFENNRLIGADGLELTPPSASLLAQNIVSELQMEMPLSSGNISISDSIQTEEKNAGKLTEMLQLGAENGDLNSAIDQYENAHDSSTTPTQAEQLRDVLIGFILEIVLTCAVLQLAFNLTGFPCLLHQIGLLSLTVALVGAGVQYTLSIGLFNPIRIGLSFILLLLLIRQLTDVREWATAIRIALLARFISLALMWLSFAGLIALFKL